MVILRESGDAAARFSYKKFNRRHFSFKHT